MPLVEGPIRLDKTWQRVEVEEGKGYLRFVAGELIEARTAADRRRRLRWTGKSARLLKLNSAQINMPLSTRVRLQDGFVVEVTATVGARFEFPRDEGTFLDKARRLVQQRSLEELARQADLVVLETASSILTNGLRGLPRDVVMSRALDELKEGLFPSTCLEGLVRVHIDTLAWVGSDASADEISAAPTRAQLEEQRAFIEQIKQVAKHRLEIQMGLERAQVMGVSPLLVMEPELASRMMQLRAEMLKSLSSTGAGVAVLVESMQQLGLEPQFVDALLSAMNDPVKTDEQTPSLEGPASSPAGSDGVTDAAGPRRRHLLGELPSRAPVGSRVSLVLRVARDAPPSHHMHVQMVGFQVPDKGTNITLVVNAPGMLPLEGLEQCLHVPPDADSSPIRFVFVPVAPGLIRVVVTAWLGGTFLAELPLELSAEEGGPLEQGVPRSAQMLLVRDSGEVTLQVRYDPYQQQYTFQLLNDTYMFEPVIERLAARPDLSVERTVARLKQMAAARSGYAPGQAFNWMRQAGIGLWHALVPDFIAEQFWQLRSSITSLTVAADQDIIPWELLYPRAPGRDEGFLVQQFPVLRRVYNQARVDRLMISEVAFVVPPDSPRNAGTEVEEIQRRLPPSASGGRVIDSLDDLTRVLETGDVDLLHFACHNTFSSDAGSSVRLRGGLLEPLHLNGAKSGRTLTRNPLVFFNACRTAGEVLDYGQQMGWASQFMSAGAGAFVGTLWAVRSTSALQFSETFYSQLSQPGQTLGSACHAARASIVSEEDPTWLAYTVYGHPAARLMPSAGIGAADESHNGECKGAPNDG